MAFVEPAGGAALEDVQDHGRALPVGPLQQLAQDGGTESPALVLRGQVEVLQPLPAVLGGRRVTQPASSPPTVTTEVYRGEQESRNRCRTRCPS